MSEEKLRWILQEVFVNVVARFCLITLILGGKINLTTKIINVINVTAII